MGMDGFACKGGWGKEGCFGKGKGGPAMYQQGPAHAPAARRLTPDQLKGRLHELIYAAVEVAAAPVAYLETQWADGELVKRVVRYLVKPASDTELYSLPWPKMIEELVTRSMHGYSAACQDCDWFFSIELAPVFFAAASEIMLNNGVRVSDDMVYEACVIEYEDKLDRILLDRAMWEAVKGIIGDVVDEKSVGKVFTSLSKTYWPALDEVLSSSLMADFQGWLTPEQELQRVEQFIRKWAQESMCRAYYAFPDSETVLTVEVAETLFRTLLAPFGNEDPFSCVPQLLTETIGRPPTDWAFISQAVYDVFSQFMGGASKKRKKGPAEEWPAAAPVARATPGKVAQKPKAKAAAGGGNPSCTSEGDCIGTTEDIIMQHMLNGEAGDLYCKPCWDSFVKRNPELEGVPLE